MNNGAKSPVMQAAAGALMALLLAAPPVAQAQVMGCEKLRDDIAARAKWTPGSFTLDIVDKDAETTGQTLGVCEGGSRRIVVNFGTAAVQAAEVPVAPPPAPATVATVAVAPVQPVEAAPEAPAVRPAVRPATRRGVLDDATREQYLAWIAEARAMHPYADTVDRMFAVMMCESKGDAEVVSRAGNVGLFQYVPSTWRASWNSRRDASITDPRAQIFATAEAWARGMQRHWSCYKQPH